MNGQRFQNYEAYFTVLNTRESIDKEWLNSKRFILGCC